MSDKQFKELLEVLRSMNDKLADIKLNLGANY